MIDGSRSTNPPSMIGLRRAANEASETATATIPKTPATNTQRYGKAYTSNRLYNSTPVTGDDSWLSTAGYRECKFVRLHSVRVALSSGVTRSRGHGLRVQYKRNEPMSASSSVGKHLHRFHWTTTRGLTFQGRQGSVSQLKNLLRSVGQVEIMSGQHQPRAVLFI